MKKVKIIKYQCPYCGEIMITKKDNPLQCPKCHRKFKKKKPIIIKEVRI